LGARVELDVHLEAENRVEPLDDLVAVHDVGDRRHFSSSPLRRARTASAVPVTTPSAVTITSASASLSLSLRAWRKLARNPNTAESAEASWKAAFSFGFITRPPAGEHGRSEDRPARRRGP